MLSVVHVAHLVRDVFEVGLETLDEGDHLRELGTNDGELDERLAERRTLVRPLKTLWGEERSDWGGCR